VEHTKRGQRLGVILQQTH